MPKAPRAHKHSRPSEPVTPEILKVILIKTSQLQKTFRDFNEDYRNDRRSDIIAKFIAECDRVHGKFRENDKWSYKDFIEYNLDWVARRYRRDAGRAIENRPPEMASLDAPVESEDGEATKDCTNVEVVCCTPAIDIPAAVEAAKGTRVGIGGENAHWKESGAYTGEISTGMLVDAGAAVASMTALALGFGVNVLLDPFFIFSRVPLYFWNAHLPGLGLGISGAAWATVAGMFSSFLYAVSRYLSGRTLVRLRLRAIGFHRGMVLKPCGIGLSPFLQQLFGTAINVVLPLAFAKWAADEAAATTQIASLGVFQSVMIIVVLPILGAQQGIQPIIGYNWGARNFRRVRSTLAAGLAITTILCVAATVAQTLPPFPRLLASLFVSADNPKLLGIAARDLAVSNCMLWCISLNIVATTYFQSIGRPAAAIVLSTLRQGVCLMPIAWFLPYFMEDHALAVWISMPVSDVLCCLMTIVPFALHLRFLSRVRDKRLQPQLER